MVNKKALNIQINELMVLQTLSRAYAEIAALRMRKTRTSVILNRNFLVSITKIFQEVINSYRQEVLGMANKRTFKNQKNITFLAHNGKSVAVLLSANVGLYGDIVGKTFNLFAEEVRNGNVEVTIIGRLGLSMFRQNFPGKQYTYFDFPDASVRGDLMTDVIAHLVPYEEIHIYYGKFRSVITQEPTVSRISSSILDLGEGGSTNVTPKKYIFEPSLDKILKFFEGEMFTSIMDQVLRESQLAKFASRITAMTKAGENITQNLKKMEIEKLKLIHSIANKKQIDSLSSIFVVNSFR